LTAARWLIPVPLRLRFHAKGATTGATARRTPRKRGTFLHSLAVHYRDGLTAGGSQPSVPCRVFTRWTRSDPKTQNHKFGLLPALHFNLFRWASHSIEPLAQDALDGLWSPLRFGLATSWR
jgi:hypothetical protein